jgi:hypothetical protein
VQWLLKLIASAVWPTMSIAQSLQRWNDIAQDLAERSRRRMPQIIGLLS